MSGIRAIVMKPNDNVATVVEAQSRGAEVVLDLAGVPKAVRILEGIPFAHKFAICDISLGDDIIKYGEVIGIATKDILCGQHVHVHNLESRRGRGDHQATMRHQINLISVEGADHLDAIRQLFQEYAQSLDFNLFFQDFEKELASLPGKYAQPDGALILAQVDGQAAGCIALRKISEEVCEMKRLYVRDAYRGLRIGHALISRIIEEAAKRHYCVIRLDTAPTMQKAQSLYQSFGFYDIEPYIYNPLPGARYMERKLDGE